MDSISVECDIVDVETNTSQVLFGHNSLFSGPLEAGDDRVLDLVQVLHSLSTVDEDVGSSTVWTEAPNLPSFSYVVLVFLRQIPSARLEVVAWIYFALFQLIFSSLIRL